MDTDNEQKVFLDAFHHSPMAMVIVSSRGEFIHVNNRFTEATGYGLGDMPDMRSWFARTYPETGQQEALLAGWMAMAEQEKPVSEVLPVTCRDGESRIFRFRSAFSGGFAFLSLEDVTGERRNLDLLVRSERNFRTIFDSTTDAIFVHDAETGRILETNQAFLDMYGYAREEAQNVNVGNLSQNRPPYTVENAMMILAEVRKGKTSQFEWRARRRNGQLFWADLVARPVTLDGQERIIVVARDVTDRREAEEALAETAENYRSVFNATSDAIVIQEPDSAMIIDANRAAARMLGYSRRQLRRMTAPELLSQEPEQAREMVLNAFDQVRTQGSRTLELQLRRKDGTSFWVGLSIRHARIGGQWRIISVARDIDERKQAENKLRLSSEVFSQSADSIVITDAENVILEVNRSFTRITGYSESECIGKKPSLLKSGRHDADFYREMWTSICETGYWSGEIWNRKKNGEMFPAWLSIATVRDRDGAIINFIGTFSDLSEAKRAEESIHRLHYYDLLTGLPNRALCLDRLAHDFQHSDRDNTFAAVLVLGLDGFKTVNESLGIEGGDELLRQVAERLDQTLPGVQSFARLGSDTFAAIAGDMKDPGDVAAVIRKMQQSFASPFYVDANEVFLSACIGASLYPQDGDSPQAILNNAENAMRRAKANGPNSYGFFAAGMAEEASERLHLEADLRRALERGELLLHYQPKVNVCTGAIEGAEALVRWNHPERGMVPPFKFIPFAEERDLIHSIGEWVLRRACRDCLRFREVGHPGLCVAVNISPKQFFEGRVDSLVRDVLADTGLPGECLEVEITEQMLVSDMERTKQTLVRLKEQNVSIAVDDFGTGYSSLSYLTSFPLTTLKVDRSFVMDVVENRDSAAVTGAIISMARSLGLGVVAEGAETAEQVAFLHERGCVTVQGYYYSRPVPLEDFLALLKTPFPPFAPPA